MTESESKKLGEQLLEAGIIDEQQLEDALQVQKQVNRRLGNILIDRDLISEEKLVEFLSNRTGYPVVDLENYPIQEEALETLPREQAEKYNVLPLICDSNTLTVAMQDPMDLAAIDDLSRLTELEIEPMIASASQIEQFLGNNDQDYTDSGSEQPEIKLAAGGDRYTTDLEQNEENENIKRRPAVQMVNRIIRDALDEDATNVHIDPRQNSVEISFRIEGQLCTYTTLPARMLSQIVTRLRVMSDDSKETESEFGGYRIIRLLYGEEPVTIRMNRLQTRFGTKLMMKICRDRNYRMEITELGMDRQTCSVLEELLSAPRGMLIYTGPDDSGKTTSLYASLRYLSNKPHSIVTIEDPIEAEMEFCTQLEAPVGKPEAKAAEIYKAIRADPDVIMVGDIGEPAVARATLYAAATGRKVLSSYYADNTVDALFHLANTDGVDRYQLANSVIGVVSQRLIRLLDDDMKQEYEPSESELDRLCLSKQDHYYQPGEDREQDYDGVTGIFQILPMVDELRLCILEGCPYSEYMDSVRELDLPSLREKGARKVQSGATSIQEVLRETFREDLTAQFSLTDC